MINRFSKERNLLSLKSMRRRKKKKKSERRGNSNSPRKDLDINPSLSGTKITRRI
jgi:hypothetical protein